MNKPRKHQPRRLQFETLEAREVMTAGLMASLNSSGVLTITGTSNSDVINFKQTNGVISVQDVVKTWTAAKVKSIVVDVKGGDDVVSFNSWSNGGNQAIAEKITFKAGAGNDTVHLGNGQDVHVSGVGNVLSIDATGSASMNGKLLNFTGSIQTSFVNGVLTVTGTNGNDTLNFLHAWNGYIGIQGVSGAWPASGITAIVVNLQEGNDIVSLDSLANGGTFALNLPVTINSGFGNKRSIFANGHYVDFTGYGHQVTVTAGGVAKYDGYLLTWNDPAPDPGPSPDPSNWFDSNVQDAALRSLGHSLYTDGLVNRSDVLALLRGAEDGGVIDSTELADLQLIANTTSLFGGVDSLQKLTSYVVATNYANRNYQGQALGNLNAGSVTAQMDKLINKWFLGLDRPTASGTYRQIAGTLFVNGVAYSDVHQGSVGDCYFVSSLGEAAFRDASKITSMFTTNDDGTYTVRFFNGSQAYYVTVDSYLPTNGSGQLIYANPGSMYNNSSNELWVVLAEKAYCQLNEFGFSRAGITDNNNNSLSGLNSYSAIEGGYIYAAQNHITGLATSAFAMTSYSSSLTTFVNAYNAGKMIGFASYSHAGQDANGVVGSHAYAVVGYNAANQTVTFFNPWGTQYGLLTLNWTQIAASFMYFDRTA